MNINFDTIFKIIFESAIHYPSRQLHVFFLSGFSFTDNDDSQDSKGREGTTFNSILPFPPAHEYWEIYLRLRTWYDYHIFLIATLVFTRLLLYEIYQLIDYHLTDCWRCNVCLLTWWIDSRFLLQRFDMGNRWMRTRIDYHLCITSKPTNQLS